MGDFYELFHEDARRGAEILGLALTSRDKGENPIPMAGWGIIVAYVMFIAAIPFFLGLAIALPVLGHATWHLYRKVVEF